jgi:hypothetical protein
MGRSKCRKWEPTLADWLSPDTWKPAADLVSDWKTIGGAAVLVGGALWRWGAAPFRWIESRFRHDGRAKNRVDLRFVPDDHSTYWSVGTFVKEQQQAMTFWGRFNVTNVSDQNVFLLKFRFPGFNTERHMLLGELVDECKVAIPRRNMCQVDTHCLLRQMGARESFVTDVIFTDNFGDEHMVRSVRFDFRGP